MNSSPQEFRFHPGPQGKPFPNRPPKQEQSLTRREVTGTVPAGYSDGHSIQHQFRHALHRPNGSSASTNGLGRTLAPEVTPFYRLMLSVRQWLPHSSWATSRYLSGVIHTFQRVCDICQSQCILYLPVGRPPPQTCVKVSRWPSFAAATTLTLGRRRAPCKTVVRAPSSLHLVSRGRPTLTQAGVAARHLQLPSLPVPFRFKHAAPLNFCQIFDTSSTALKVLPVNL
jgi:hypothetical protein